MLGLSLKRFPPFGGIMPPKDTGNATKSQSASESSDTQSHCSEKHDNDDDFPQLVQKNMDTLDTLAFNQTPH